MISFFTIAPSLRCMQGNPLILFPFLLVPLFIEHFLSFLLLLSLIKPISWILLFDRFPMPITILKSEFQIKSYGISKFQSLHSHFPPHFDVASKWLPVSCAIPMWHWHGCWCGTHHLSSSSLGFTRFN